MSARAGLSRRRFLAGSGLAAGLAAVTTACRQEQAGRESTTATTTAGRPISLADLAMATLRSGLEVLAINTYKALLEAADAGDLGYFPEAGRTFVRTAVDQHQAHLAVWNKVLKDAGRVEITLPNARLHPIYRARLDRARSFLDAARLALTLEEMAAATYLAAISTLEERSAVKRAASIQAVDAKHVAILRLLLGDDPVPDTFAKEDGALKP